MRRFRGLLILGATLPVVVGVISLTWHYKEPSIPHLYRLALLNLTVGLPCASCSIFLFIESYKGKSPFSSFKIILLGIAYIAFGLAGVIAGLAAFYEYYKSI